MSALLDRIEAAIAGECSNEARARAALAEVIPLLREPLVELTQRCDGAEGVRADGTNIDTLRAHIALERIASMTEIETDFDGFEARQIARDALAEKSA